MTVAEKSRVDAEALKAKHEAQWQREQRPIKVAQTIFRQWCGAHGAVVDVEMAADLVKRIEHAIKVERR